MNQNDLIINYIDRHGSITPKEAVNELDVWRLSSRINEIKKKKKVKTTYIPFTKASGKKSRYAKYEWRIDNE